MGKNSTLALERIQAILKTNADGSKQFGLRDQHKKLKKDHSKELADSWVRTHIKNTLMLRELMAQSDWLGVDSETTTYGVANEMVELGMCRPDRTLAFESFIKPTTPITSGATVVHGLTNEMVADAPTMDQIRPAICAALEGVEAVILYNAEFDIDSSEQSCFAADCDPIPWPHVIDVMPIIAAWIGDWNSARFGYRWAKLEGGHRAVGDVQEMIRAMELCASSNVEYARGLISHD